ncbi:MAG: hypothetical protein QOE77_622 [Blastocatellia bacterium]|nr:hypothetical protein [Blastocatellia bacterium]
MARWCHFQSPKQIHIPTVDNPSALRPRLSLRIKTMTTATTEQTESKAIMRHIAPFGGRFDNITYKRIVPLTIRKSADVMCEAPI